MKYRDLVNEIGLREVFMFAGLGLLAVGLWMAWRPLAPIAVGALLVYLAIAPEAKR